MKDLQASKEINKRVDDKQRIMNNIEDDIKKISNDNTWNNPINKSLGLKELTNSNSHSYSQKDNVKLIGNKSKENLTEKENYGKGYIKSIKLVHEHPKISN